MAEECASCGTQNRDGARFCKGCGHRLMAVAMAANDRVASAGWPITERTPLPEEVPQKKSSSAADERTVVPSRSPSAPSPVPARPAPVPPSPPATRESKAASRPAALPGEAATRRSSARWGILALLLVLLAGGGWYMHSRRDVTVPTLSQAPAAAGPVALTVAPPAPVQEAASHALAPEAEAPAPTPEVSSPSPKPEPVPPVLHASDTAEAPAPTPPPTMAAAEPPVSAPTPADADAPAKPVAAPVPKRAAAPAPKPAVAAARKTPPAASPPAPQAAPTPAAAVAGAPAEPVVSPNPEAACAGQGFFGRVRCMAAQCAKPENRAQAQCDAVRRQQQVDEEKRNPSLAN